MADKPPLTEAERRKKLSGGNSRLWSERRLSPTGANWNRREYEPALCEDARKLAKLGCTDLEIADYIGCRKMDILRWRADHPEFDQAMAIGQETADNRVQMMLYQRAIGYSVPEVKLVTVEGKVERHEVEKHYPADVTAITMWLTNRQPEHWRKVREWAPTTTPDEARASEDDLVARVAQLVSDALARKKAHELAAAAAAPEGTRH